MEDGVDVDALGLLVKAIIVTRTATASLIDLVSVFVFLLELAHGSG